jgi:hypothetical protein
VLYHLAVACSISVVLIFVWVAVQALVRRASPRMGSGADVLACRMCAADGSCSCGLKRYILERGADDQGRENTE